MYILICERKGCDGTMVYDKEISQIVCSICGTIEKCQKCDGYITYNRDIEECICEKCGTIYVNDFLSF